MEKKLNADPIKDFNALLGFWWTNLSDFGELLTANWNFRLACT